ncbi:vWA domain-containing protein [Gemmata sp.]|uniref:vWA domain-containing protein n=1 Tax=Gemmata sp. TaxID=1914242 RepID=UPI003F6EBF59
MGQPPRSKANRFRLALAGSVVVHVLLVSVASVALRPGGGASGPTELDTRVGDVALRLAPEEVSVTVQTPDPPQPPQPAVEPDPPQPEPPAPEPPVAPEVPRPRAEGTAGTRTPVKTSVPNALPAEVVSLIRRPKPQAQPTAVRDPNVRPAGATTPAAPLTPAIHGAMRAGQTVVYVLDCSGSMGEFGKLTLARAALVITLRRQPADLRFQVLAYSSAAKPLVPGPSAPATPANIAAAESALGTLKASGRSNHVEAVRAALALRPDVIVVLTDAEELTAASLKAVLNGAGKPAPVCVARVSAHGVGVPREVK